MTENMSKPIQELTELAVQVSMILARAHIDNDTNVILCAQRMFWGMHGLDPRLLTTATNEKDNERNQHRRLILDLDEKSITFDPPFSLPFTAENGNTYDEMMATLSQALTKFGEMYDRDTKS